MEQLSEAAILSERAALYGDAPAPRRAAELAAEATRMVEAVRAATHRLAFEDEPSAFPRVLKGLA
jgi:hypothetical protein